MTRINSLIVSSALVACVFLSSCGGGKPKSVPTRAEAHLAGLTAADTTEVLTRAHSIVDKIVAGDVAGALDGLGQVQNDTLYQISSERIAAAANQFEKMNLRQASLESYSFIDPDHNVVKFRVSFGHSEDESKLLSTAFAINALKIEGNWYFTLMR